MSSESLRKFSPILGLSLLLVSGCIKSVCETDSDCPDGRKCPSGTCIKPCASDNECSPGKVCDRNTGLCQTGCRNDSECPSEKVCVQNQCWPMTSSLSPMDGGPEDGGALVCSCLPAPRACLVDINPASPTTGTSACQPGPRASVLFFGNVGCSHCQHIFGQLLDMEAQLRREGFDPTLAFVQLKDWSYTGAQVTATFPTHQGPVLQDTASDDMWGAYSADWYEVKIIDSHGCLSAFFASPDTMNLMSSGRLQTSGSKVMEAWRSAMGADCHVLPDAGLSSGSGL